MQGLTPPTDYSNPVTTATRIARTVTGMTPGGFVAARACCFPTLPRTGHRKQSTGHAVARHSVHVPATPVKPSICHRGNGIPLRRCLPVVAAPTILALASSASSFLSTKVHEVPRQTNRASVRERDLPPHVMVYYVIALVLYMRSFYCEVLRCLLDPSAQAKVAGKSGISQARSILGPEPLKTLYEAVVAPIPEKRTKGASHRE